MASDLLQNPHKSSTIRANKSKSNLPWYFAFFVVSGFCGLVYEVVWLGLAMASFGVTTALTSIVLSAFMAGLGLGSWGAGSLTRRVFNGDGPRALRTYSVAELLVGVSSITVPLEIRLGRQILLHLSSFGGWQTFGYYVLAGLWIAVTLVPWCACMGSTFPILMAVIRRTDKPSSDRSFSYLYLANVLGALTGTLASAFVIIELLGFRGTLYVAGSLNVLLALAAFAISFSTGSSPCEENPVEKQTPGPGLYGLPRGSVLLFLFITGLVSMGMEIVWIRQLTPYLGNVVYTFADIVAVYLLCTAVGSQDYRTWARSHLPGQSISSWTFLALFATFPLIAGNPSLPTQLGGVGFPLVRVATICMFCALTGFLTPLLVDSWSSGDPDRAGTAYAFNIAGCIAGPLVSGFILLPRMSERWAIVVLAVPLFGVAAVTALRAPITADGTKRRFNSKLKVAAAVIAAILLFSISRDFETSYPQRVVRRDYTATVIAAGTGFNRLLLVNGVGMTLLTPITKTMAHLPLALMQRPPKNGLVICFGMGTSFRSMLSWGIRTTAVDLVPSVPALMWYFQPSASELAASPLAHIVIDDGRRFLDGSTQTYDVIVVDPPPPPQAPGSSLLYSREFFAVVKRHLQRDGILQIWYPTSDADAATLASVAKSLVQYFPYVRAFWSRDAEVAGVHFLASMEPVPIPSSSVLAARLPPSAAVDFVEWGPEPTAQQRFQSILSREVNVSDLADKVPRVPALRDDQPINEYFLLRDSFHVYR